jgi:hypothetical protein
MENKALIILRHVHSDSTIEKSLCAALNRALDYAGCPGELINYPAGITLPEKLSTLLRDRARSVDDTVFVLGNNPKLITPGCMDYASRLLRLDRPVMVIVPDYQAKDDCYALPQQINSPAQPYDCLEHTTPGPMNPNGMFAFPVYLENFCCRLGTLQQLATGLFAEDLSLFMLSSEGAIGLDSSNACEKIPVPEQLLKNVSIFGGIKLAAQKKNKQALQRLLEK